MDIISESFSLVKRALRMITAGGMALCYYGWVSGKAWNMVINDWSRLTGFALLSGLAAYLAYVVVLGPLMGIIAQRVILLKWFRVPNDEQVVSIRLFREGHSRLDNPKELVRTVHARLKAAYPWVVFAYCESLLLITIALQLAVREEHPIKGIAWLQLVALPLLLFVGSFWLDVAIVRCEKWLQVKALQERARNEAEESATKEEKKKRAELEDAARRERVEKEGEIRDRLGSCSEALARIEKRLGAAGPL